MFIITAVVIAALKGHKSFAWAWGGLVSALILNDIIFQHQIGSSLYVKNWLLGIILLIIAICKKTKSDESPAVSDDVQMVLCCPKCGRIVASFGANKYTCSKCGPKTEMVKTNVSAKDWISKNEDEKKKILKSVNILGITTVDYVKNEKGTVIDCKDSVPSIDKTLQVPVKITYPTIEQKDVAILYCRNCGKKLDDDSLFCSYCGTKI